MKLPTENDANSLGEVQVKISGKWLVTHFTSVEFLSEVEAWKPMLNMFDLPSVRRELQRVLGLIDQAHLHGAILTTSFNNELERKENICLVGCTD